MAGRYKIILGMAAGAGKTYRMLQEGHAEADLGRDVAIGLVETHGRTDTQRLIEGLDVIPRRRIDYHGTMLREMDLPAVLARRPELALIDELAHTNAPGLEHAKRYEDIADILASDVDVYSTLNVQHLESLNDAVHELTGVRVRETVPDSVLTRADEVVLVDLTPEALVQRLREGKVYAPARISAALNGFFKIENLQALREVSLRHVAEDVEAKRLVHDDLDLREKRLFGTTASKPIAERLLALAKLSSSSSERVVRRAWRSSQRLGAELDILVVRDPDGQPSAAEREQLESLRRIASALGAQLLVEPADDLVDAVVRVARRQGTTYILMGAPTARRGIGRLAEPVANRLTRALPDVDVRLVAERSASG
jgi:two-component system, OmpR family, sensor histidine kinase KdpD